MLEAYVVTYIFLINRLNKGTDLKKIKRWMLEHLKLMKTVLDSQLEDLKYL